MKILFSAVFFLLSFSVLAQRTPPYTNTELKTIVGNWTGTVVLTNTGEGKLQSTVKAQLEIVDLKDSLLFNYQYTDENGKQSTEKYFVRIYDGENKISFDSAVYDMVEIRRRGPRTFIYAERAGVDNFRSVEFQEEIIIGQGVLNITKGIRYGEMVDFLIRRRAAFTKN
ncbi:MAG: hypothetical protein IPL84_00830 [Chitinophagaceae bacterium]|nr:hypothetical protein [Chitinophagaceae bacterium]